MLLLSSAIASQLSDKIGKKNHEDGKSVAANVSTAIMSFFGLIILITAILVAIQCNPQHKVGYAILAFFFPEIYLIQWGVKKYLLKHKGYCPLGDLTDIASV